MISVTLQVTYDNHNTYCDDRKVVLSESGTPNEILIEISDTDRRIGIKLSDLKRAIKALEKD